MTNPVRKVLIAEDDPNFGMVLKSYLELNSFEVLLAPDGQQALNIIKQQQPDLAILDVMMPELDGFALAEKIQQGGFGFPFIFLTARSQKDDIRKGFSTGAIDYLVKPFDPEVLLMKIEALLTLQTHEAPEGPPQLPGLDFDADKRLISANGKQKKLTAKEAELLRLLLQHKGKLLTREEALLKIWHEDDYFTTQSMNVYLSKLRKYLEELVPGQVVIENIHGKGFVLREA